MGETKTVFFIGDVAMDEYYSAPLFRKIKEKILVQTLPAQMGGMIVTRPACTRGIQRAGFILTAL